MHRPGYPTKSFLDERAKTSRGRKKDKSFWIQQFQKSQYSKDDLERGKNEKDGEVKRLEEELGKAKKETARAERIRKEKRRLVRGPHTPGRRSYLHARDTLREAYANQQHIQHALDKAKKERTWFNQVHDVAGSAASGSAVTRPPVLTAASKSHYRFEEDSRKLDINSLLEDQNVVVAFAATDYGVKKMSETVFLPRPVLEAHLNQFAILEGMFNFFLMSFWIDIFWTETEH